MVGGRSWSGIGVVLAALAAQPAVAEDPVSGAVEVDGLVRQALMRHPGLAAARSRWSAARLRVPQVSSLPDPRLSYGYYAREVETRVGPQRHRVGIAQRLPWWGTLVLRGEAASEEAFAARRMVESAAVAIVSAVRSAYAEHYYVGRALRLTGESTELLRHWERIARARYRVGTGTYADVIRAQVELAKLEDRRAALEDRRPAVQARLNAAIGRSVGEEIAFPSQLPAFPPLGSGAELRAELGRRNPALGALDARIGQRDTEIELAEKHRYPDVGIGLQWIETGSNDGPADAGRDPIIAMLTVDLPVWWDRIEAGVEEARVRSREARSTRADQALALEGALEEAVFAHRDAIRRIALYDEGLVPKAKEALAATFTSYESGRSGFLDLLDAQRVLLELELVRERARADQLIHRARIDRLLGRGVPGELDPTEVRP